MTATNTDLLRYATPNFETTLNGSIEPSDETITLQSTGGLSTDTAVTLVIDATDTDGNPTPTSKEVLSGVVNGVSNQLVNCLRGLDGTTGQSHATGAVVTMWITANLWNDLMAALLAQHNQAGGHEGLTNTGGMTTDEIDVTGNSVLAGPISGAGYTMKTMANPYKCRAYWSTSLAAFIPADTDTKIRYDTATTDPNECFDATHNRIVAQVTGTLHVNAMVSAQPFANDRCSARIYKNGELVSVGPIIENSTSEILGYPVSDDIDVNENDYLEIFMRHSVPGSMGVIGGSPNTYFSAFLISKN